MFVSVYVGRLDRGVHSGRGWSGVGGPGVGRRRHCHNVEELVGLWTGRSSRPVCVQWILVWTASVGRDGHGLKVPCD